MPVTRSVLTCIAALLFSTTASAADSILVPPNEAIAGRTQREWSVLWWQWASSFEDDESPVADRTGEFCAAKQTGKVWFLAGTYGTKRTVRRCRVPAGQYLFFPLINYVVYPRDDNRLTCSSVTRQAAAMTDDVSSLVLDIDGTTFKALTPHRQATIDCFDLGAKSNPPERIFPTASNGYYVMLRPLPRGRHTLNFGGALPRMLQAVTYMLEVE